MAPDFEKVELAGGRAVLCRADCLEVLAAGLLKCDAIGSDPPYGIGFQHSGGGIGNLRSPRVESYQERIIGVEIDPKHFDTACARIAEWWAKHGAGDG